MQLDDWKIDLDRSRWCHRTGLIVEFLVTDRSWTAHVARDGSLSRDDQIRYVREAADLFAAAAGGAVDGGSPVLSVPADWLWPLEGFDSNTGELKLRVGFVEALAAANGLKHEAVRPDMLAAFLLDWYKIRRAEGAPVDPTMEAVVKFHEQSNIVGSTRGR